MRSTLLAGFALAAGAANALPSSVGGGGLKSISLTRRDPGFADPLSGEVNIEAVEREVRSVEGKYAYNNALLQARKNGNTTGLEKRASASVRYDGDSLWSGTIQIGNPPQSFSVYFDTACSDLLLASSTCTSADCNARKKYDRTKSSTAVDTGKTIYSYWTEGTFGKGRLVKDTVTAAGLTVTGQDILALDSYPSLPAEKKSDGFGLGYRSLSLSFSYSFPFTLLHQITSYPSITPQTSGYFALRLSPTPGQSQVTFGGYNRAKVGGNVRWLPVTVGDDDQFRSFWQIGGSAFFVNKKQATDRGIYLFDSGSSLLVAPPDVAADFWAAVPGARQENSTFWSYPCNDPPTVSVSFARITLQTYAIHPDDFNLGVLPSSSAPSSSSSSSPSDPVVAAAADSPTDGTSSGAGTGSGIGTGTGTSEGGDGSSESPSPDPQPDPKPEPTPDPEPEPEQPRCLGAVVGRNLGLGGNTVVLGEPFFRSWYMAFDAKNNRVGITQPKVR
ncbi:hypothetical protein JCM6882_001693 [Rhodosporidiobolus microsporus]